MRDLERSVQELRISEQAILKQSLDEKIEKVRILEREVEVLRGLLADLAAVPRPQPSAAKVHRLPKEMPRRWRI